MRSLPRPCRQQHVEGAPDVGLEVLARVAGRDDDVAGRQVEDELVRSDQALHDLGVAQPSLNELASLGGEIVAAPVNRSSSTVTLAPSRIRRLTSVLPTNPAPPVTRMRRSRSSMRQASGAGSMRGPR